MHMLGFASSERCYRVIFAPAWLWDLPLLWLYEYESSRGGAGEGIAALPQTEMDTDSYEAICSNDLLRSDWTICRTSFFLLQGITCAKPA